jgi:predicted DNA-binding ribbon-helix-helix protein
MPNRIVANPNREARHDTDAFHAALDEFRGRLISHHIRIGKRRTSIRLTWRLLQEIADRERITVHELCTAISSGKRRAMPLSVAVRTAVLRYYLADE